MKTLALSPYKTYIHPVMRTKDIAISEIVYYGGEDSESIPAGFVAEWRFEKPKTKKQKKNARHRIKSKTLTPKGDNRGLGVTNMKS